MYRVEGSRNILPASLDLFTSLPTNGGIENEEWVDYAPTTTQNQISDPVEFIIPRDDFRYTDLRRSFLFVTFKFVKADGNDPDAVQPGVPSIGKNAAPINNVLHSYWDKVDYFLNGVQVGNDSVHYGYKSIFEQFLYRDYAAQNSQMSLEGFYRDIPVTTVDPETPEYKTKEATYTRPNGVEEEYYTDTPNEKFNRGLKQRNAEVAANKEFMGCIFTDFLDANRLILNGVEIRVKMRPSNKQFYMVGKEGVADAGLKITSIYLRVCKTRISPDLVMTHNKMLLKTPAIYPFTRTETYTKTLALTGQTLFTLQDEFFQGRLPQRLVLAVVEKDAYVGNQQKNPYEFKVLTNVAVLVDGKSTPYANSGTGQQRAKFSRMMFQKKECVNFGNISIEPYENNEVVGTNLYCFGFSGQTVDQPVYPLVKSGRMTVQFSVPTTANYVLIMMGQFADEYRIDKNREIIISDWHRPITQYG